MSTSVEVQERTNNIVSSGTGLHKGLWVVQGLLGVVFLAAGSMKTLTPIAELQPKMAWIKDGMEPLVRFIGVTEVLGAVGLADGNEDQAMADSVGCGWSGPHHGTGHVDALASW